VTIWWPKRLLALGGWEAWVEAAKSVRASALEKLMTNLNESARDNPGTGGDIQRAGAGDRNAAINGHVRLPPKQVGTTYS